jgi:hypothetical protein
MLMRTSLYGYAGAEEKQIPAFAGMTKIEAV